MKTKLVIGTIVVAMSMLLSGCGSDTPESVAVEFAETLSKTNLNDAKVLGTEDVQKNIERLNIECHKVNIESLSNESMEVLESIYTKIEDEKYKTQAEELLISFKKNSEAMKKQFEPKMQKIQKELIEKYGSMNKVPKDVRLELLTTISMPILKELFIPIFDNAMKALEIKTENLDKVKKVLMKYMVNMILDNRNPTSINRHVFYESTKPIVLESDEPIKAECIAKYTDFGFIDSINIIETITKSPDKSEVRLELIYKDDKSKKVSVDVEKIKDEWKVSSLLLDLW